MKHHGENILLLVNSVVSVTKMKQFGSLDWSRRVQTYLLFQYFKLFEKFIWRNNMKNIRKKILPLTMSLSIRYHSATATDRNFLFSVLWPYTYILFNRIEKRSNRSFFIFVLYRMWRIGHFWNEEHTRGGYTCKEAPHRYMCVQKWARSCE